MSYVKYVVEEKEKLKRVVESLLSQREAEEARRDYHAKRPPRPCGVTIHPGTGCALGCKYCYIYDMGFNRGFKPSPLRGLQLVYALLSNNYFVPGERGTYLAIGSVTEPFHPALKNKTLEYVEASYKYLGNPTQLSTKWYVDPGTAGKLAEISGGRISPLVTLVTLKAHRELEPGAPSPEKRLESIRNLRDVGLNPFLFLRPIIPGLTEGEYEEILDLAADYGAVGVVAGSLRVTKGILDKLKEAGVEVQYIVKRLKTPLEKMKPRLQYDVYTGDIKREIEKYARKKNMLFYPSACMANLYSHGLKCWRMCTGRETSLCGLEEPSPVEVCGIARALGATKCIRVYFNGVSLTVEVKCRECDHRLIGEFLRSRYLVCTRVLKRG